LCSIIRTPHATISSATVAVTAAFGFVGLFSIFNMAAGSPRELHGRTGD